MFDLFLPSDMQEWLIKQQQAAVRRRLQNCVPWSPKMKWVPELNLQAATYRVLELFHDVRSCGPVSVNELDQDQHVDSPGGTWRYVVRQLERGDMMSTVYGSEHGTVLFDGPARVPALYHRREVLFREKPYMSLTPMEIFTLRGGTRRAKGRVIVAGLGLGHQLIEVSKRTAVKQLTLVEIDRDLVDWLLPHIEPHLGMSIEVAVGNAYEVIPKMQADVVLLDIFPSYGSNHYERDKLRALCPDDKVGFIWAWGSADLK